MIVTLRVHSEYKEGGGCKVEEGAAWLRGGG